MGVRLLSLSLASTMKALKCKRQGCFGAMVSIGIFFIAIDVLNSYLLDQAIIYAKIRHNEIMENKSKLITSSKLMHPECHCPMKIANNGSDNLPPDSDLTCSRFSGLRGFHQRVISFTYYEGDVDKGTSHDLYHRDYFAGVEKNLELMLKYYGQQWVLRLYYEIPAKSKTWTRLCQLVCNSTNIDICDVSAIPALDTASLVYPMDWRFFPLLDKQVDIALIRDLDSDINPRELAAVKQFLKSNKDFHIMRDHPGHGVNILGGTWGVKLVKPEIRQNCHRSMENLRNHKRMYYAHRKYYDLDQQALTLYFWPWAKDVAMEHDSYTCQKFPNSIPFPTKRPEGVGNFVCSIPAFKMQIHFDKGNECPYECRPETHKDWEFC